MRFCTSADASDIKLSIAKLFPKEFGFMIFSGDIEMKIGLKWVNKDLSFSILTMYLFSVMWHQQPSRMRQKLLSRYAKKVAALSFQLIPTERFTAYFPYNCLQHNVVPRNLSFILVIFKNICRWAHLIYYDILWYICLVLNSEFPIFDN